MIINSRKCCRTSARAFKNPVFLSAAAHLTSLSRGNLCVPLLNLQFLVICLPAAAQPDLILDLSVVFFRLF